jgi:hypothetical protein
MRRLIVAALFAALLAEMPAPSIGSIAFNVPAPGQNGGP